LDCSKNSTTVVKPGSFGECSRSLQKVDSSFVEMLGSDKWTEIVNFQLEKFSSVHFCEVIGFSY